MAYTGTGTEQDPYLVSTLTDLVALMADGVYIKVVSDIDASQEEAFKEPLTSGVVFRGNISADETKIIANVIVESVSLITFQGSYGMSSSTKNIFFKNWIHRKTANALSIGAQYATIENCCFSIEMIDDSNGAALLGKSTSYGNTGEFTNCTFSIKFASGTSRILPASVALMQYVNVKKCTFIFENLLCSNLTIASSYSGVVNCTFLGNIEFLPSGGLADARLLAGSTSKVIMGLNVSIAPETESGNSIRLYFDSNATYVMLDSSILGDGVSHYFASATCRSLTTGQIQSQQYLEDIGFLP